MKKIIDTIKNLKIDNEKPFCAYLYDLNDLYQHTKEITSQLPDKCEMFYAVKANSDNKILSVLDQTCNGFEVASLGELKQIRSQFPNAKIIFGGPGKTLEELEACIDYKVELIHVESFYELLNLYSICGKKNTEVDILLRLNIEFENLAQTRLTMGGKATPFGMDEKTLEKCLKFLNEHSCIHLKGFHFHLMSFQTDEISHAQLIGNYIDYLSNFNKKYDLNLNHLNVGGGIGVNYLDKNHKFNWQLFLNQLNQIIKEKNAECLNFRFECGRSLSVYCGFYATEVLDIKENHNKHFAVCRGGTHHFRTPFAQSHSHPFEVIEMKNLHNNDLIPQIENKEITIVGQLCTPKDIMAYDKKVDQLKVGDIILFSHAGAYAWNISHHDFLCHPHPDMIYLD